MLRHVRNETGARSETGGGQVQDRQRPAGRPECETGRGRDWLRPEGKTGRGQRAKLAEARG